MQINSIKNCLLDEYEHVIINNAVEDGVRDQIQETCTRYGIRTFRNSPIVANTSIACASALNNLRHFASHCASGKYAILESDVFCFGKVSFENMLNGHDIAGIYQQREDFRLEYLHACFSVFKDLDTLSKLQWDLLPGADTGAKTSEGIRSNNLAVKWLPHTAQLDTDADSKIFFDYEPSFGSMVIDSRLLHYNRGSGWNHEESISYHNRKTSWTKNFLQDPRMNLELLNKYQTPRSHAYKNFNGYAHQAYKSEENPYFES